MTSTTNRLKEELLEKCNKSESESEEDEFEMDEEGMDMSDLLKPFLQIPKKNRNVCDILVEIKKTVRSSKQIIVTNM